MEHLEDKWEIWEECVVKKWGGGDAGHKGGKPVVIHMGGGARLWARSVPA